MPGAGERSQGHSVLDREDVTPQLAGGEEKRRRTRGSHDGRWAGYTRSSWRLRCSRRGSSVGADEVV